MKQPVLILIFSISLFGLIGCNSDVDSSATKNVSSPATANTNNSPPQEGSANQKAEPAPVDAAQQQAVGVPKDSPQWLLQGTYAIAEVHHEGIVDMIKAETTTEIIFKPPASFSRLSKREGKVYHTDSGQYAIDGDTLTLQIALSNKQLQQPPVRKTHKFSISPDGNEFKLTSDKNNTAVFRRIRQ